MKSRAATIAIVLLVLLGAGGIGGRVGAPAWRELKEDMPVLRGDDLEAALGEGITMGLLGGFRAVTADFLWVRANATWEDQDLPTTQTLIRAVTAVDSRPLVFWINGARMIAYDMPVWRIEAAGGFAVVPRTVQARIDREQALVALAMLDRGLVRHPGEPLLIIEKANIHLRRLGDRQTAAELYREAAGQPGAPYYAARIYGELLKQLGRHEEAYTWLKHIHAGLPADDPMANRDLVLGRIRELEDRLGVPRSEQYQGKP